MFYVPWRSGVKVQFFSRNPRCSLELSCQALARSLSGIGLNRGQGKFGPQCWFIFAGTRTFLGTTRHLLVFQVFGTASVGEVQYQGISSRWRWLGSSLRGLFTSKERPPPSPCQCDHCVRIQENRQVVVIAGRARDTRVEADQTYYTRSQRAVLFCFDWTNICESIMRLHLQTRA